MIEIDRADDTNLIVNTGNQGGGTRNMTQVNMITAVNGNTITVRNPFIYDFSTGSPKLKFYYGGITKNSGVENLKLEHSGFSGGYNFYSQYCDSCWLNGIESARASGYHFVMLGSSSGNLLASTTFTGETASGWQAAPFDTPVEITANATYIASYHTNGFYPSGGNGVYVYGSGVSFPFNTYLANNYWVDVMFQ